MAYLFFTTTFTFSQNCDGTTSSKAFTSLGQARNVPTAGIYYFNLDGTSFSTYVDANGYVMVAQDFGDGVGNLPQGTSLNTTNRGILNPTVLSKLTTTNKVRISHSNGVVDATTTNASIITRVIQNTTLHQGINDNPINDFWTGTGSSYLIDDASATTSNGTSLHQNIFHARGNSNTTTWIPSVNYQRALWSSGEIGATQNLRVWVQADNQPLGFGCGDYDGDGIDDDADDDDDNDGIPDQLEQQYQFLEYYLQSGNGSNTFDSRDRGAPNDLERDFIFDLDENTYKFVLDFLFEEKIIIETTLGDQLSGRSGNVTVDGVVKTISTQVASFQTVVHQPLVSDYYEVILNGNDLTMVKMVVRNAFDNKILAKFDFGTNTSNVATGYTKVSELSNVGVTNAGYIKFGYTFMDTDGDGVPNQYDLDSDADGCSDAIESNGSIANPNLFEDLSLQGGSTSVYYNLGTTVDGQGIPTIAAGGFDQGESRNSAVSTSCTDTDGDNINDYVDLDADNDGILTENEIFCESNILDLGAFDGLSATTPNVNVSQTVPLPGSTGNVTVTMGHNSPNGAQVAAASPALSFWARDPSGDGSGIRINGNFTPDSEGFIKFEFDEPVSNLTFAYTDIDVGNITQPERAYFEASMGGVSYTPTIVLQANGPLPYQSGTEFIGGSANSSNVMYVIYTHPIDELIITANGTRVSGDIGLTQTLFNLNYDICTDEKDTDGDGIPNYLDLDSDADGCPDAIEGGGTFVSSDLVTDVNIDGGSTNVQENLGNTIDANGVPVVAGPDGQPAGYSLYGTNTDYCRDTDGDGLYDYVDLDDDNDGILDTKENEFCSTFAEFSNPVVGGVASNTSVNGEFYDGTLFTISETADFASVYSVDETNSSCVFAGTSFTEGEVNTDAVVLLASNGNSTVEINFNQPVSNILLHIEGLDRRTMTIHGVDDVVMLSSNSQAELNGFVIRDVNVSTVHDATCANDDASIEGTFKLYGIYSSITLEFNNNGSTGLDGFFIQLSTEGCSQDTDEDGIPNHLDLDSDADGCADAIEGGATFVNPDLFIDLNIDGGSTSVHDNLGTTVDSYGVPVVAGSNGQTIGVSRDSTINDYCLDTDSDGVNDYVDIDDDNDGIPDVEECQIILLINVLQPTSIY